jgi:hypothetical protein
MLDLAPPQRLVHRYSDRVAATTFVVNPKSFSTQSLPLPLPRCSRPPTTGGVVSSKVLSYPFDERFYPIPVEDVGRVDFRPKDQPFGVHQEEVTLPSLDLLAAYSRLRSPPTPVVFTDWLSTMCPRSAGRFARHARGGALGARRSAFPRCCRYARS